MGPEEIQIELYKAYINDLGRIGTHHTQIRAFYVSIISAFLVFLAATATGPDSNRFVLTKSGQIAISILGVILCIAWFLHMLLLNKLYKAKYEILRDMETTFSFPYTIFNHENDKLKKTSLFGISVKSTFFTTVECWVALFVIVPFLYIIFNRG